ncbi:hypothetical protein BH582_10495 [Vibrio sp. 10N.222.47.A9]|nr:hypothetical protein BH582_10495 [Vibrio sp. 10N.222.47.A9]
MNTLELQKEGNITFCTYLGGTVANNWIGGNSSEQLESNKDWEKIACESRNRVGKQDDKRLI